MAAAAAAAAVQAALEGLGIRVRPEWLEACLSQLPPPPPGPPQQREQWVLAQVCGGGRKEGEEGEKEGRRPSIQSTHCCLHPAFFITHPPSHPPTHPPNQSTMHATPTHPQPLLPQPHNQVYERFLHSDLNASGRGEAFPQGLSGMREHVLAGTHVLQVRDGERDGWVGGWMDGRIHGVAHPVGPLTPCPPPTPTHAQVDAIKNISQPAETRGRAMAHGAGRCLLLALTDGARRAVGMEYGPIPDLQVDLPPGVKVAVSRCRVKEGVLFLVPGGLQVLGGSNGRPAPPPSQPQQPPSPAGGGGPPRGPPRQHQVQQQQQQRGPPPQQDAAGGGGGGGGGGTHGGGQQQRPRPPPPRQQQRGPPQAMTGGGGRRELEEEDPYDDPAIDWGAIDIPDYSAGAAAANQQPPPQQPDVDRELEEAMLAAAAAMEEEEEEDEEAAGPVRSRKRPRAAASPTPNHRGGAAFALATAASSPATLGPSQSQCSTQASGAAAAVSSAAAAAVVAASASSGSGNAAAAAPPLPPLSSLRDEAVEGPFVSLAEWRRFHGQSVRVRGVVTQTLGATTNKKTPLRVTVLVEDGSGTPLRARLSNAFIERLLGGLTPTAFRALYDRDRAEANRVLAGIGPAVYKLEGVLTLRLPPAPASAALAGDAQKQQQPPQQQPTAVLVSCEDPTWDDVRAMVRVCGARLGVVEESGRGWGSGREGAAAAGAEEDEEEEEVIVLSGGD